MPTAELTDQVADLPFYTVDELRDRRLLSLAEDGSARSLRDAAALIGSGAAANERRCRHFEAAHMEHVARTLCRAAATTRR